MIYVAAPYFHVDKEVIAYRMEHVYKHMANLTKIGNVCVSPMLMHPVVERYNIPNDFTYWKDYSLQLLAKCDTLYVIELDGWKESKGVETEIKFARDKQLSIWFVDPVILSLN
jgi:hypothetical protein